MDPIDAHWSLQTPAGALGPVAVVLLTGDVDRAFQTLGIRGVRVGQVAVRDLAGIDTGVVARWAEDSAHLMPHGGPAVIRALLDRFRAAGLREARSIAPRSAYPEARDDVEARMVDTLARAASPLAIDLLLDQPRRWRAAGSEARELPQEHASILRRLIDPPLVVAVGPPNVGKSTLVNALAGRRVAIVADQPGTTRDHVGVTLDLAGLVVRYVDTPGVRDAADVIEHEATDLAMALATSADLLLLCGDPAHLPPAGLQGPPASRPSLRVALRADLGEPDWPGDRPPDAKVSALTGVGLPELVALIRDTLVPPMLLEDSRPWRFWTAEPSQTLT